MSALPVLLFWIKLALAQDQWRIVHRDGSVEAVWGDPRVEQAKRGEDVLTAWVWSGVRIPRRVSAADIGRQRPVEADAGRLAVRVVRRGGGKAPDDLRLIAA